MASGLRGAHRVEQIGTCTAPVAQHGARRHFAQFSHLYHRQTGEEAHFDEFGQAGFQMLQLGQGAIEPVQGFRIEESLLEFSSRVTCCAVPPPRLSACRRRA